MAEDAPPLIDDSRVLQFADVESLPFARDAISLGTRSDGGGMDWEPVGRVPRLAICEFLDSREICLHRCDASWSSIAVSVHASISEARTRAEQAYPGCEARWLQGRMSHEEAVVLRRQEWGDLVCSRCDRTPDEFESLVSDDQGRLVCNECQ